MNPRTQPMERMRAGMVDTHPIGMKRNCAPSASGSRSTRVFVMDESPLIHLAVGRLIEGLSGWSLVGTASSSSEALEVLDSDPVDLVILELSNRDGAGMDLIKDLRLRHPKIRILVLSCHSEEIFARRAVQAGADGFVSKLADLEIIRSAIDTVASGETYLSPELLARFALQYLGHGEPASASGLEKLSNRELQVFRLLGSGQTLRSIALALGISVKTVETYIDHLKHKLGVESGVALAHRAVQWMERGLLQ